jgi:hypothetical protein
MGRQTIYKHTLLKDRCKMNKPRLCLFQIWMYPVMILTGEYKKSYLKVPILDRKQYTRLHLLLDFVPFKVAPFQVQTTVPALLPLLLEAPLELTFWMACGTIALVLEFEERPGDDALVPRNRRKWEGSRPSKKEKLKDDSHVTSAHKLPMMLPFGETPRSKLIGDKPRVRIVAL